MLICSLSGMKRDWQHDMGLPLHSLLQKRVEENMQNGIVSPRRQDVLRRVVLLGTPA